MKKIIAIISSLLLSFGVINISVYSNDNNGKSISPVNDKYTFIKQDGFIDLGYNSTSPIASNTYVLPRTNVNMVNFDMNTRSQSFESFNPDSYGRRGQSSSSTSSASIDFETATAESIVYSAIVNGEECLYTEGYSPNAESIINSNISAGSNDPNDDREPVANPKIKPYLSTGRTSAYYYNIKNNIDGFYYTIRSDGTGFLEGPNLMVTAGHCVYGDVTVDNFDDGKNNPRFPDMLTFYPGLNGSSEKNTAYTYYCEAKTININTSYYINRDAENDWAAVELDRNIGYSTGWNGKISNWYSTSSQVSTYGYPGDKDNTMWKAEGKIIRKDNDYRYTTNVYGVGGQSGSAYFMTNSQSTYVWGILTHNYTYDNWETIAGTSGVYINNFIFHYLNSFVTNHNYEHLAATIIPTDYGFADAYPTDDYTKTNYITHTLSSGFQFQTRRYRTGYIHNEYIVMSPFRNGITEAFIEYKFDVPVSKIEVDLSHWRLLSHEWTYSSNCTAGIYTGNKIVLDLLASSTNLPTDRTQPNTYTIEFDSPVYSFKFYMESKRINTNNDNRGRLCIGDMKIYTTEGWH